MLPLEFIQVYDILNSSLRVQSRNSFYMHTQNTYLELRIYLKESSYERGIVIFSLNMQTEKDTFYLRVLTLEMFLVEGTCTWKDRFY